MYIDKLIKKEVITLLVSVSLLVIIFIGITYAKFLSVDKGQDTVINMGDLNISFCKDTTCDSTYTNIGQVIGTKVENGVTVPASIYPFKNDGSYSNETPYIFKIENTGSLDSTVKIKLKEDASFTPSGDYSSYARLTSKYADHLKVAIKKKILYQDTGYQFGDVNMDGLVNLQDVNLVLQAATENATLTDVQKKLIGLDSSATISAVHAANILQILNGTSESPYSTKVYTYSDLEDGVIFKDDIIKSGESATYFLWLYLDETTPNDAQKTYFVGNIDVDGEFIPKVNPVSFATDSWETIVTAVKENNIGKYNVGDTKEIDMGTYGTHTLRIANTSTPSECSTAGFSQSACGFVIEFADIITTHSMNDGKTNVGGWPASEMYAFINNDIYNVLPNDLKNNIISTVTVSGHGYDDSNNFTSTDKLYLFSPKEVYSNWTGSYETAKDLNRTLDYYTAQGITTTSYNGAIKNSGTTATAWWLRSGNNSTNNGFYSVRDDGSSGTTLSTALRGVSPAFRIG